MEKNRKRKKVKFLLIIVALIMVIVIVGFYYYTNNAKLVNVEEIKTDSNYEEVTYDKKENIMQEDVLGILTIEKIGLEATVKEGSDSKVLSEYIGHIEQTATYDGNIGLAGHNRGNKYSYFARINELKEGDIIKYKTKFYTREYKVDNIKVIYETDWTPLENTKENKITMITCIANKRNQRLCVQATQI